MQVLTSNNRLFDGIDKLMLVLSILFVLLMPVNKKIWYDETVSVLCSKGIGHNTPTQLGDAATISNAALESYNTPGHVFDATVVDNSNSYLYNISLHFFTRVFGNSMAMYILLSRLFGAGALIAFYSLSRRFIDSPLFRAIAIFLLVADPVFWGMSVEIRAYSAGIFFICLSALCFTRFLNEADTPRNLFLALLFSAGAVLTHFLTIYVLLVFALLLLVYKGKTLLAKKYILPVLVPVALLVLFFFLSVQGLQVMNKQNAAISEIRKEAFTYSSVFFNFIKFTAVNMKVLLPAFHPSNVIKILSLAILAAIYIMSRKIAADGGQKRRLNTLLLLALSGSVFLTALAIAAGHNTSFYNRYFSFSIPFNCLFIALFLQLLFQQNRNAIVKYAALAFFVLPVALLFYKGLGVEGGVKYSHTDIANTIITKNMTDVEVAQNSDALLIHSFLPRNYPLTFHIVPGATHFRAYNATAAETIPIIRIDN